MPTVAVRETCQCKRHANLEFEAHRLKQLVILDKMDMEQVLKIVSCDVDEITCMYGKCQDCSGSKVLLDAYEADEESGGGKKETKTNNGKEVTYSRVAKEKVEGTIGKLVGQFQMDVIGMKTHAYNI